MTTDQQTIHFFGGPLDGATIRLDADIQVPDEIIFRHTLAAAPEEVVYRYTPAFHLSADHLAELRSDFRLSKQSEIFRLVHSQARMIVAREEEIKTLQDRLERTGRKTRRLRGAQKAAKTRRKVRR